MEASEQRRVIEALILAVGEPISASRLAEIVPDCTPGMIKDRVNELNTEYQEQDRSFEVWEVAGGYQMRTRAEFSGYLQRLRKERPLRLSRAALETLAIVAYRQPVTRAEVDRVRGVDSGAVLKGLLERHLVRLVGHREVPGRPMLYGTSRRFLEVFGLQSLEDLPALRELEELAREHGVEVAGPPSEARVESAESDGESAVEGVSAHESGPGGQSDADAEGAPGAEETGAEAGSGASEGDSELLPGEGSDPTQVSD